MAFPAGAFVCTKTACRRAAASPFAAAALVAAPDAKRTTEKMLANRVPLFTVTSVCSMQLEPEVGYAARAQLVSKASAGRAHAYDVRQPRTSRESSLL